MTQWQVKERRSSKQGIYWENWKFPPKTCSTTSQTAGSTLSLREEPQNSLIVCRKLTLAALILTLETSHSQLSQIFPPLLDLLVGPEPRIASIYASLFSSVKAKQKTLKGCRRRNTKTGRESEEGGKYFLCPDERRNTKSFSVFAHGFSLPLGERAVEKTIWRTGEEGCHIKI